MRPVLVIFDCDGVLVDSEPISNRLFVEHLNRAGFPFTLEECYRELIGRSMASCEALLVARFGRPLPEGFVAALQADTYAALTAEVEAVPGVSVALDALEAAGVPYCVASSGEFAKMRARSGEPACCRGARAGCSAPPRWRAASRIRTSSYTPRAGWELSPRTAW